MAIVPVIPASAFSAGLTAAVVVTRRLHGGSGAGLWAKRLGSTRLRYANLPVGGTLTLLVATRLRRPLAAPVCALGVGAVAGAVGWGLVDPLPPA